MKLSLYLVSLRAITGLAALGACQNSQQPASSSVPIAADASPILLPARSKSSNPRDTSQRKVSIPRGSFLTGTTPGQFSRQPPSEPSLFSLAMRSFQIDALPYQQDGQPRTGIDFQTASLLCSEKQGRLCTELEWERACKGSTSLPFAGSSGFDAACSNSASGCTSDFGVSGMGSLKEWTDSFWAEKGPRSAIRGAEPSAPSFEHRCARRGSLSRNEASPLLSFRCCYGPRNSATVSAPTSGKTFRTLEMSVERLEKLLAQHSQTTHLSTELQFFSHSDAVTAVTANGKRKSRGFLFSVRPLLWRPEPGAQLLVVTGRSGKNTSFVATYQVLAEDSYRLASSFVMKNEPGPVVLAYNGYIRPRLHFSTCWGCLGETGKILYRPNDSVVIRQH